MNPHAIMSHRETGREELFNPIDQKCVTFEEPYKRLLASIMLQSFDDLTLKLDISDSTMCGQVKRIERNRLEYRKAADWFMSKSDHFTSFLNICDIFGFCSKNILSRLKIKLVREFST